MGKPGASAYKPLSTTEHLEHPEADPEFKIPSIYQRLQLSRRRKHYRIVLRSDDRVAGTITNAVFDLGDLRGAWLLRENLDAGIKHWVGRMDAFCIDGTDLDVPYVEVRGINWPLQVESFDSDARGPTQLLGVAGGTLTAGTESTESYFTLRDLPAGRVGVRLVTPIGQAGLDADGTAKWVLVVSLTPTPY